MRSGSVIGENAYDCVQPSEPEAPIVGEATEDVRVLVTLAPATVSIDVRARSNGEVMVGVIAADVLVVPLVTTIWAGTATGLPRKVLKLYKICFVRRLSELAPISIVL
jgi:hypothetical protein